MAAFAVATLALLGACSSKSTTTTLSLYEREDLGNTDAFQKAAPNFTAGDRILEIHPLFTVDGNAQTGTDATNLAVMHVYGKDPLVSLVCQTTLGSDTITWGGMARFSALMGSGATVAITGGTGKYKGATGTVFVKGNKRGGKEVFDETYSIIMRS
jgi:hypothetical protein